MYVTPAVEFSVGIINKYWTALNCIGICVILAMPSIFNDMTLPPHRPRTSVKKNRAVHCTYTAKSANC